MRFALLLPLFIAGCAMGPNYSKPEVEVPAQYKEAGDWVIAQPKDALPKGKWWEAFNDPVLDSLMPDLVGHDRQPSAFLVYLFLWRQTHGSGVATTQVALRDIAERSGLSKRAVQGALAWLVERRLIGVVRESITAVPVGVRRVAWYKPLCTRPRLSIRF